MNNVIGVSSTSLPTSVRRSEPLSGHSTLAIGGAADFFAEPTSDLEVLELMQFAKEQELPHIFIGGGSNLLFDDRGFRGLVVKLGDRFASYEMNGNRLSAQAGVWVPRIARISQQCGYAGLEHIVGIPGTIGGLVAINGGSQRKGIGSHVDQVVCLDGSGEVVRLAGSDCEFSYRHSKIKDLSLIVLSVQLVLGDKDEPSVIRKRMRQILRQRRRKFPLKRPNCGSVFLSSPEIYELAGPPGQIIERCGLKGARVGNAEVSDEHANFFINRGGATSSDFRKLIDEVHQAVFQKTGVRLCCEVQYVSEIGRVHTYEPTNGVK